MTTLACAHCGNTELTFDFDSVITIRLKDGELTSVNVGGVLDGLPDQYFCANDACPGGQDPRPVSPEYGHQTGDAIDAAIKAVDPNLLYNLANGTVLFEGPR